MELTPDGNILLAALPLQAVLKVTPQGKVIWRAGTGSTGGADATPLPGVSDLAQDAQGRIWLAVADADEIVCLSPDGKRLFQYGVHTGIDDRQGRGFDRPTGVAVAASNGAQCLYVGDSGNQRIVKFRLKGPDK